VAILLIVVAAVIVFVIAAVVIGRETRRLDLESPRPVFDVDEAVAWVAERLPEDVTTRLGYDDVRLILEWSLERLPVGGEDALVGEDETVAHLIDRGIVEGQAWSDADIWAVVVAEVSYLREIGAVGFPPPEKGGGPTEDQL
jgi:hypothetical protein